MGSKVLLCGNIIKVHVLVSGKHDQEGFLDRLEGIGEPFQSCRKRVGRGTERGGEGGLLF